EIETTTVDTVFYYNSLKELSTGEFVVDVSIKRTNQEILEDPEHANLVLDSLHEWIADGQVRIEFPKIAQEEYRINPNTQDTIKDENGNPIIDVNLYPFEEHDMVRKGVFGDWFTRTTNNRTFIDLGDDNNDNIITFNEDPTSTEKLINNVPYYYRIVPFDEGDWIKDISQIPNITTFSPDATNIKSIVAAYPEAPPVGKKARIEIIEIDSLRMGGIHNMNFFAIDEDRLQQKFAGDTLELTFAPRWVNTGFTEQGQQNEDRIFFFDLMYRDLVLTNISENDQLLYSSVTQFEPTACDFGIRRQLTENAASYVVTPSEDPVIVDTTYVDGLFTTRTITMHKPLSTQSDIRTGHFTTGILDKSWCYAGGYSDDAFGILGFEYDYTVKQLGGFYRPLSMTPLDQASSVKMNLQPITYSSNDISSRDSNRVITNRVVENPIVGTSSRTRAEDDGTGNDPISVFNSDGTQDRAIPYRDLQGSVNTSFNNGGGTYLLEFEAGGEEIVEVSYGGQNPNSRQTKEFRIPYLNIKIVNQTEFKRYDELTGDSIVVEMPREMENFILPTQEVPQTLADGQDYLFYPHPANLPRIGVDPQDFLGNYNIYSIGWVDVRDGFGFLKHERSFAYPTSDEYEFKDENIGDRPSFSGLQGKYYLSGIATDGSGITIDFTNIVNVAGAKFAFDRVNVGTRRPTSPGQNPYWQIDDSYTVEEIENLPDFQAGDQVELATWGSAQGLPWPGFTVKAVVTSGSEGQESFSESEMENISISPNPYFITHENQQSPFASDIYFQRLPEICTIEIYTQNGELIQKIDHNSKLDGDKRAVAVWDIMTKSGLRAQSQTLVALIKANGAEVAKTFSIVVGSYRVIED
ncbi:hypothetical protein OAQ99_07580, partial [Candidatus Kapabacteria bacterium]|nr:hypothetical protein [Candidatus Kapabacteria bacterium]